MDGDEAGVATCEGVDLSAIAVATKCLRALFDDSDLILLRPIETWSESGIKRSRVIHDQTVYRKCTHSVLQRTVQQLLTVSTAQRANVFFGVCSRFGKSGRFDLAWQIRTVRCLWSDIDHIAVDQAIERCSQEGLPPPSLAVNSGSGAHVYWLLDEPYRIDDVGDPPEVLTEWIDRPGGRKKPRRYILEGQDRVYLDQRRHLSRLSPRAQHVQNILAGIASAIGGDHTTDLSRLLRVPGTLNRKDERNGRPPLTTELVVCEPSCRYPIAEFEQFATDAPGVRIRQQIGTMPLPRSRKLTTSKADKLAEFVAASAIAPGGTRSEADFALCCYAIRTGISQNEVWAQVSEAGKFAEEGERYFNITWENAAYDVRAGIYEKLQKRVSPNGKPSIKFFAGSGNSDGPTERSEHTDSDDRPTIEIDPRSTPVSITMGQITARLLAVGDCYTRVGQLVVIRNKAIAPILSASELAGLLNHHVEFFFVGDDSGEFRPLPATYANTWLNHPGERARFSAIRLFTHNPVYAADWWLVKPGYDRASEIYYCGPEVPARYGTEHLDRLLRDFCFKSPADRTNYLGLLLTPILVPRFIGSKPAALFNGNQPELGKSILAQIIAILRDGSPVETATYNPNDEEFEKRLGAIVRRGATTIIVDNAKARGRSPRIDSACLERSITDAILSFRLLGFSQDIRVENSHMFCVTANTPDVSRDLVTRSVVVNLYYDGNPTRRAFSIADPEGYAQENRFVILGELIGMVERWKASGMPLADAASRFNKRGWAQIVGGILEANDEPDFLSNTESAATELDETHREFAELVTVLAEHEQGTWTGSELAQLAVRHGLLRAELGESSSRSQATRIGVLAGRFIAERFEAAHGGCVVFHRSTERKGHVYRVEIVDEVPNVGPFAERLPNVANLKGSAP